MKLLLVAVNAKYIHSNLAVYCLRAYAGKHGFADQVSLAEYTINHSEEDILREIYKEKADVIAFSCYIWNIEIILRLINELKKVQPEAKLWLGGPEVSYDSERRLKLTPGLEGIMIGEGEQTFLELVQHYTLGEPALKKIKGIAYRDNNLIRITEERELLALSDVPFPYVDIKNFKNRIIYYESSRGCPFSCSYCLSSVEKRIRFRDLSLVKQELLFLLEQQVPQVKFVDRTFNCNKEHAMAIWQFIKENDNGITNFHFEISADLLTDEELSFLATLRIAQVQFEIGVQSTNPDTVAAIRRRMDLKLLRKNVDRIRVARNIHQHLDLIAGLPNEDYKTFEQSFHDVYEMKPDQLQLGFLKVLRGSPMEAESKDFGIVYRDNPPYEVLYTRQLSYEELLKLKGICEMVEVYYNSGQFTNAIGYLEHYYPTPMKLYEELAGYYESKHMDMQAHSRIRRYELLLDFFQEKVLRFEAGSDHAPDPRSDRESNFFQDYASDHSKPEKLKLFEEILLMDLFLREDMKSRPPFAMDRIQKNHKNLYDEYRREQILVHIETFQYDIETSVKNGEVMMRESTVIFNYSERDPITKSATLIRR